MGAITDCLRKMNQGERVNSGKLYELAYDTLRKIAARRLAGNSIIRPTELVHETWLRLSNSEQSLWQNSKHFFHAAAEAMRYTLVDHIRRKNRIKRGAAFLQKNLDECSLKIDPLTKEILNLNEALECLELSHPNKAEIVKLKFFAGMTIREISKVTDLSPATVERHWAFAKAWLHQKMGSI